MPHSHNIKKAYADCVNSNLHEAVSAWFLGPQAENADILTGLFAQSVNLQKEARLAYFPEDGPFITANIKESKGFQEERDDLITQFTSVSKLLFEKSIPFFSQRYAGHMCFEMGMPGILGWAAGMLNNPNNVAFEASPMTTIMEIEVGRQLCEMLGYKEKHSDHTPLYWGHITCDGTVANLEFVWVARNIKYYSLSLRDAMKPGKELEFISDSFEVLLPTTGKSKIFAKLTLWELLNLTAKTILDVPERLEAQYGITPTYLDSVLSKYIVQTRGKQAVEVEWGMKTSPRYFISGTKHYSWPKSAAITGIGSENMIDIAIDTHARVDIKILRQHLEECLEKQIPVFGVVAIIGSTEEGSVDPLDQILDLRDEFQARGLCFLVHADAAWGGYFASMICDKPQKHNERKTPKPTRPDRDFVPTATLRDSTVSQFRALARTDSITIDPHKAGYIPYPTGALCYRDGRMRYLVTWSAPYIQQGDSGESIGVYGVEGSKPGAAAVAAYLHHNVVGLHKEGHGALLGEVSWSCRRISAHWAAMSVEEDPFIVVPLNPLRFESDGAAAIAKEKNYIRESILPKSNEVLAVDPDAMAELQSLGSDLNINAFACNFRIGRDANTDVEEANYLNNAIFKRLSITDPKQDPKLVPMFLSATTFKAADYGVCLEEFKKRLKLETESNQDLFVLRNVCMSPFQAAGDFLQELAKTFQDVLIEEMGHVISRNTITRQNHSFILHWANDKAFLVYQPYFHNANGRFQAILSADITSSMQPIDLKAASGTVFLITEETNMVDICKDGASFRGTIKISDAVAMDVHVSNIRVIKNRPLDSRWRDNLYPASFVPFYLFGVDGRYFIDHMLVKAPNAQLTAEVSLNNISLDNEQLAGGLLLSILRPEAVMQPGDAEVEAMSKLYAESTAWFSPGKTYDIAVYKDTKSATAHGPGLASAIGNTTPIATGTITIMRDMYVEYKRINTKDFTGRSDHHMASFTSRKYSLEAKAEWRRLVQALA